MAQIQRNPWHPQAESLALISGMSGTFIAEILAQFSAELVESAELQQQIKKPEKNLDED